jgi:hypothetical protein
MSELRRIEAIVAEIDDEVAATEHRLEQLRIERIGAQAILSRLRRTSGSAGGSAQPPQTTEVKAPEGNLALVESILASAQEPMHLNAIEAATARLGRPLNNEQIRSAVTYLKRKELAERVGRGTWVFRRALIEGEMPDLIPRVLTEKEHDFQDTETPDSTGVSVSDRSNSEDRSLTREGGVPYGTVPLGDHDASSAAAHEDRDRHNGASVKEAAVP